MADELFMKDDPQEMKKAREASFLCDVFQQYNLNVHEKQMIIKNMIKQFKLQRKIQNG